MIRIVLILLLLVNNSARGQMRVGLDKDSLRRILMTHPPDTDKVATLILLGQQYENIQPDTAILYYQQAGQLSQQLNYPAGTIRYINNYTAVLNVRGRFDEALRLNLQALQIAESHGLDQLYTKALINTAAAYQYKEDYPQAAAWYLKALPRLATVGDAQSLSLVYGNLCSLYRALGQPDKALGYARNSLQQA
ncbi:MAG: tetratricopeptide repeat protein, partial [Bacteroidetes bacterium]|nr:tetratricopeptide repeat protein [Bacteroidota bacterium]